jgi:hypothetical protein
MDSSCGMNIYIKIALKTLTELAIRLSIIDLISFSHLE